MTKCEIKGDKGERGAQGEGMETSGRCGYPWKEFMGSKQRRDFGLEAELGDWSMGKDILKREAVLFDSVEAT